MAATSRLAQCYKRCAEVVQRTDREAYVGLIFAPKAYRDYLWALRALYAELAHIPDQVTAPQMAILRYNWWKQCTMDICTQSEGGRSYKGNELCEALQDTAEKCQLAPKLFEAIIDTRIKRLGDRSFGSLQELESTGENTVGALLKLQLACAKVRHMATEDIANNIGKAASIVTVLRATPFHARKQACLVPQDLLAKYGVSQEEIMRGQATPATRELFFELASGAQGHIEDARTQLEQAASKLPVHTARVLLGTVALESYLDAIRYADFDVFDQRLQRSNGWLPFKMAWSAVRNTI